MDEIVLLHISDLHYGIDNRIDEENKQVHFRQMEMIENLINSIANFIKDSPEWKPNIIAISGDIAWTGQAQEYQLYKKYFVKEIENVLGITSKYIITCPGNHDIIREKAKRISRYRQGMQGIDPDVAELTLEEAREQAAYFENYVNELCEGDSDGICKVVSFQEWPWISFVTLNSAWDCRNDLDEGRLRVGLPILEELIGKVPEGNCIVTLFHHPHTKVIDVDRKKSIGDITERQWLHISERESGISGGRTFASYVENKSMFILNGHIHKETDPKKCGKAIQLISGTVYSSDTAQYHCRLLKISNKSEPLYRDIRSTMGTQGSEWEITIPKHFLFEHIFSVMIRKAQRAEMANQITRRLEKMLEEFEKNHNKELYMKEIAEIYKLISQDANGNNIEAEKPIVEDIHMYTLKNEGEV